MPSDLAETDVLVVVRLVCTQTVEECVLWYLIELRLELKVNLKRLSGGFNTATTTLGKMLSCLAQRPAFSPASLQALPDLYVLRRRSLVHGGARVYRWMPI